ncbi:MAG: hypothetical protein Q9159_003235 [Coniocarpon cinnabarinum]
MTARTTYLVVFVVLVHPPLALPLGDDLTGVFEDDLVLLEGPGGTDAKPLLGVGHYLYPNFVCRPLVVASPEVGKGAVSAVRGTDVAEVVIALIHHGAIQTSVTAAVLRPAQTRGAGHVDLSPGHLTLAYDFSSTMPHNA